MNFTCQYDHDNDYIFIIEAPDDIAYFTTLRGWYWNFLDYLDAERHDDYSKDKVYGIAWRAMHSCLSDGVLHADGRIQAEYRHFLMLAVSEVFEQVDSRLRGHVNDAPPRIPGVSDTK